MVLTASGTVKTPTQEPDLLSYDGDWTAAAWPAPLADYSDPPVVETVMAVQFEGLRGLDSVRLQDLWRTRLAAAGYVDAQERERYSAPLESFDLPRPGVRMEVSRSNPGPRYWFTSETGEDLIQLQNDWAAFNWRKSEPDNEYRHYEHGRSQFVSLYEGLTAFCADQGLGEIRPTQAEISYINHVMTPPGEDLDLARVLVPVSAARSESHLPDPESIEYTARYVARDSTGAAFARLHVVAEPIFAEGRHAAVSLRLTFRGRPPTTDASGVLAIHDVGHGWIVGAFDELTTDPMHDAWGRKERK